MDLPGLCLLLCWFIHAITPVSSLSFQANRILHNEKAGSSGGRVNVNYVAASAAGDKDLGRKVVLIRIEELTSELIWEIKNRRAPIIIIVLPASLLDVTSEEIAR